MAGSRLSKLFALAATALDRRVRWDRQPLPLALATLVGLRSALRRYNLYDPTAGARPPAPPPPPDGRHLTARSPDGSYNDLADPPMGRAGTVFGRNVPISRTYPEPPERLLDPDPSTVSRELLARERFLPATTLNVLAAVWLQFEIRDWFSHEQPRPEDPHEIPLADDDPWPERPMRIPRTPSNPPVAGAPPTFTNVETHWWDASQLYGSDQRFQDRVRTGSDGRVALAADGTLPLDPTELDDVPGGVNGWWLGLALMHVLFMREHNAVCDRLRAEHPTWSDDRLFDHARLVVAALIAKIHTVEWTPGILGHPALQVGMRANWWGLAGERLHRLVGRVSDSEVVSGIPGSPTDHHGVPYAITEEFVAVYRMHPLIPDDYTFRSAVDDRVLAELALPQLAGRHAHELFGRLSVTDALYSLGVAHPGAITLRNYPRSLQDFEKVDGSRIDLAAVDVLRTRERGVPRYNEFRRLLRLPPARSFEELAGDADTARRLRQVYGDVERVDLMVGLYAERPPAGFGFSDTAFRIFILMASRRLSSDRFFTTDYTAEVYTEAGLEWIARNDMRSVLLRHFPALGPALRGVDNAFAPWRRVAPGG